MLDSFVFFHLGSDARVSVQVRRDGVSVGIDHNRVRPFQFELGGADLTALVADPAALEEALLDQLVKHRRA